MTPIPFRGGWTCAYVLALALVFCSITTSALAGSPTTELNLSGLVETPGTFNIDDLTTLPATTQPAGYKPGYFTGAVLWDFLQSPGGGGGLVDTGAQKNDVLRDYVVAIGSDGYRAVFSLGEIHPEFGNRGSLIAYLFNGSSLGDDGFARTTAPGDVRGARYVKNLAELQILSVTPVSRVIGTAEFGTPSEELILTGWVARPRTYNLRALQRFHVQATVTVSSRDGPRIFTGVPLWALLKRAGIITDPSDPRFTKDVFGQYVVATGSDNYKAVFALGEILPRRFDDAADKPETLDNEILVAYEEGGGALPEEDGFARIVVPGDDRHGRYVSALIGIEVFNTNPCDGPRCFRFRHHRTDGRDYRDDWDDEDFKRAAGLQRSRHDRFEN